MDYLPHLNSKSPWLTYSELVKTDDNEKGIIPKGTFDSWKHRGKIRVTATGGNGRVIYIEYDSLPKETQKLVKEKYGEPAAYIAVQPLKKLMRTDDVARQWFATKKLPNGQNIPIPDQVKYARSCDWLNLIDTCLKDKRYLKDKMGISIIQFWEHIATLIRNDEEPHDLPGSVDRIREWHKRYKANGYECMLSDAHKWGNDFARKVNPKIERLIVSLYCMPHKPYMAEVCKLYREFMGGKLTVVDICDEKGGEVFNPLDFYIPAKGKSRKSIVDSRKSKADNRPDSYVDEAGVVMVPYVLGESTVDYYLKQPANEVIINKRRMKAQDFNAQYRPSVKRIGAYWAFSKITMDDVDLPFKGPDGDRVVKSYQIYDCASECVVGVAFSEDKNKELIMEALRDMFRLLLRKGWAIPFEIEMERHLTSAMKGKYVKEEGSDSEIWMDGVFTPGAVFPATRICQSAQAKRAEGFIKKKKYGFQKKRPGFQGRFYAKLLTNRLNTDEKQLRLLYEEIVANELEDIRAYNNELHPKQDLYPGLTRWQVLEQYQNPNLPKYAVHQVIQFIGYQTATSIKAGMARVQYADYVLPQMSVLHDMTYNGEIMAYYLPDEDGIVNSVFLFEDGQFLCEAKRKEGFREAAIEQTDADKVIMQKQWGQQAQFDSLVEKGGQAIVKVGVVASPPALSQGEGADNTVVRVLPPVAEEEEVIVEPGYFESARKQALNDI